MIDHDNLEEFRDPANYDIEEADSAWPRGRFYGDLAEAVGGAVLEIACGSGLVTIPLAQRGLPITGCDVCRTMLKHARHKAARQRLHVEWIEADARRLALDRQFRFIFLTGNAFQAFLRRQDQDGLLRSARAHLAAEGMFAFETRNPSGHDLSSCEDEEPWRSYTNVRGQVVDVSSTQRYDPITQIMHWTTYRRWRDDKGEQVRVSRIACRFTEPEELTALLNDNGLEVVRQYGDWDQEALAPGSPSIITVCRLR